MRPTSRFGDQQHLRECQLLLRDYGTRSDMGTGRQCDQYTASINGDILQFRSNLSGNFRFTNQGTSLAAELHSDASQRTIQTQFQKM
jgi:hypothetical protein